MKHRIFQFLDASILPDNKLIAIATDDAAILGILSSKLHVVWAIRAGGWIGAGNDPVYVKSRCFDPFPFPMPLTSKSRKSALSPKNSTPIVNTYWRRIPI
jgi:type II restriction/modification system DNA methylase subunit YeeA